MSSGTGITTALFTCAAAGVLGALLASPRAELGRFFSALTAGVAFGFLSLSVPFRPTPLSLLQGSSPARAPVALASLGAGVAVSLCVAFVALLYRPGGRGGRGVVPGGRWAGRILVLATASALAVTALDGWDAGRGGGIAWIFGANALAGAGLLGTSIVGMLLGHWYLVRVGLSERHLVRFSLLLLGAIGVRTVLLVVGLTFHGVGSADGLGEIVRELALERGFFFWQRILFGILAPAILGYMIYLTARIRSTQSATGILYVAVIFVLIGEFLARYLAATGAGPM